MEGDRNEKIYQNQQSDNEHQYEFVETKPNQTSERDTDDGQRPASRAYTKSTKEGNTSNLKTGLLIVCLILTIASISATIGLFTKVLSDNKAQEKSISTQNSLSMNLNQSDSVDKLKKQMKLIEANQNMSLFELRDSNKKLENLMMTMQTNYNNSRVERRDLQDKYDSQLEAIQTNFNNSLVELRDALWGLGGYTASNGFDYKLTKTSQNFQESRDACARMGGHLAYVGIRNNTTYSKMLENVGKDFSQTFFDLSDIAKEGEFRWGDGVLAKSAWTNWGHGEPSDGGGNEDCASAYASNNKWDDVSCGSKYHALCERRSF